MPVLQQTLLDRFFSKNEGCEIVIESSERNGCQENEPTFQAEFSRQPVSSDYERMREERIRQNMEQMKELGLWKLSGCFSDVKNLARPSKASAKRPRPTVQPTRRSTRIGGSTTSGDLAEGRIEERLPLEKEIERNTTLSYVDSSVCQYVCATGRTGKCFQQEQHESKGDVNGFIRSPKLLSLQNKVYSLDELDKQGLLVAGGHQGYTAVYRCGEAMAEEESQELLDPLLSFKSHRGWVSDVQFLSAQSSSSTLLLTASNDASLKLWDLNKTADTGHEVVPKELLKCDDIHSSGIFSMHERETKILTASKDSTCVLSGVSSDGVLHRIAVFDEIHSGVIKCVRWKDEHVFGTGGRDRKVCLIDCRSRSGAYHTIENAHFFDVNILEWSRNDRNFFLTASFDQFVHLWDARSPHAPVYSYTGHMLLADQRCKSIYHPIFVDGGSAVAVSGEKSGSLTIYSTKDGRMISRGQIGFDALTLYSSGEVGAPIYAPSRQEIQLFFPTRKKESC